MHLSVSSSPARWDLQAILVLPPAAAAAASPTSALKISSRESRYKSATYLSWPRSSQELHRLSRTQWILHTLCAHTQALRKVKGTTRHAHTYPAATSPACCVRLRSAQ